jgi:hypothetical protein
MNSRFSGSMGIQRLIKEIKRDTGGGGPPGPDSVGTSQIINGTITTADICDNAITYEKIAANAVTNTRIANLAVTHAKLSSNCVESHNILDRTILGIDISLGQIGEAHFDASFTAQLSAFAVTLEENGDAIKELQKLQGIIGIRNATTYDQDFSYTLSYKHPTTGALTEFASYTKLSYKLTASHFFKLPSLTHTILIAVSNAGGVSVEGANIIYGADVYDSDGNNIELEITDVNVMIEIDVAI